MQKIRKISEIIFLLLIHIFYVLFLFIIPYIFIMCDNIASSWFHADFLFNEKPVILLCFIVWLVFMCIKFTILPLIYKHKRYFPVIHGLLNRIISDKKFAIKYLIFVALTDILPFVLAIFLDAFLVRDFLQCVLSNLLLYLISTFLGGGALPCYLALLCSKSIKQENR